MTEGLVPIDCSVHCILLGPNYTMKKLVCTELPLILMNPLHHPVTMAKVHGFYPKALKDSPKNFFSASPSLGCATLNQNESTWDKSTGPHQATRD